MTGTQTLVARAALGLGCASAGVLLTSSRRLLGLEDRRFTRLLLAAFALSRLGIYLLVFFVLRIPVRGDIPGFYLPQGESALAGQLVYRDFSSSYAPLHPYLDAAVLRLWHHPLAIILLAVVVEILALPVWLRLVRSFTPEPLVRIAALLYLASPLSLQFVAIDGQDNVAIAGLLAVALLLLLARREFLAGLAAALPIALFKFLPLLFLPALLAPARRPLRFAAAAALLLLVVYGGFVLLHAPIATPLHVEGDLKSADNLSYLIESATGLDLPGKLIDGVLLFVLASVLLLAARSALRSRFEYRFAVAVFAMAGITVALLLFAKKAWPPYFMLALFPICLAVAPVASELSSIASRRLPIVLFSALEALAVISSSFWASLMGMSTSQAFHRTLLHPNGRALAFLAIELLLVAGYSWLLFRILGRLTRGFAPAIHPAEARGFRPQGA